MMIPTSRQTAWVITGRFNNWTGPRSDWGGKKSKRGRRMFQGHIDLDTATPVEASAVPDVLFERGLYWASGRSGVVNLVAAHKWFNLAALKGRIDERRTGTVSAFPRHPSIGIGCPRCIPGPPTALLAV
jgi:hypothetical protein